VRLVIKKGEKTVNEFKFDKGPVRIGRRSSNDIPLVHPKASKHHAVINAAEDGNWTIEDLDSANKTLLNGSAIHKAELKTGDKIGIACFTIVVNPEQDADADKVDLDDSKDPLSVFDDLDIGDLDAEISDEDFEELDLSDIELSNSGSSVTDKAGITSAETAETEFVDSTDGSVEAGISAAETGLLMVAPREPQIIVRKIGAEKAPPIRFDSDRMVEFLQVVDAINRAASVDDVLLTLLEAVAKQFGTCYTWSALRNQSGGPMTCHGGKLRDGRPLEFSNIPLNEKINQAIEKGEFMLLIFSRDMDLEKGKQIRSALIAPVLDSTGCYGAVYANNTFRDEHYDLGDLDYLMMIAVHTATVLQKL